MQITKSRVHTLLSSPDFDHNITPKKLRIIAYETIKTNKNMVEIPTTKQLHASNLSETKRKLPNGRASPA